MTATAKKADLILPASFPIESGGSFTNTQKVIQEFEAGLESKVSKLSYQQLTDLLKKLGSKEKTKLEDIRMEAMSLLSTTKQNKLKFIYTNEDNNRRIFNYGCDSINKYFEEDFENAFEE